MLKKPERGLFITGTDTEVGKTYVSSLIARHLTKQGISVGVYKPLASDCIRDQGQLISSDACALWESAGRPRTVQDVCPQMFEAPLAPHLAALQEGKSVDVDLLRTGLARWTGGCDLVLVEGAGGLMSPVSDEEYFADLAWDFGYPLLIVVPNVLGCINQAMQTLITASTFREGLPIGGIIINHVQSIDGDESVATNRHEIEKRSRVPVLAEIGYGTQEWPAEVDLMKIAEQSVPGGWDECIAAMDS